MCVTGALGSVESTANIEFRVPYSQRYLFNAIPDTNHNTNLTNPTNHTNSTNRNTMYRCEYGTINSMFAETTDLYNNINISRSYSYQIMSPPISFRDKMEASSIDVLLYTN